MPIICDEIVVLLFGECSLPASVIPATKFADIVVFGTLFNSLENILCSDEIALLLCVGK